MLAVTSGLDQPVNNGENIGPIVRGIGSSETRFSKLERTIEEFEDEDDIFVPFERIAVVIDGGEKEF